MTRSSIFHQDVLTSPPVSTTGSGREDARRNLEAYFGDYAHVTRPALQRVADGVPAAGNAANRLLVYDSAVSGWLQQVIGQKPLSPAELAELHVDKEIDDDLDTLEKGGGVEQKTMIELRSAKLALDRMVYLARIAQGIEGGAL